MKLGFLTACLPDRPLDRIAPWAAENGFEALEVAAWPRLGNRPFTASHIDVENFDADKVRALFDRHGLALTSLAFYDNNLHPDPDERTPEGRIRMRDDLAGWSEQTGGKPVVIADIGNWTPTELNPHRTGLPSQAARGEDYGAALDAVRGEPWFAGWHWCAYVENTGRGWGLKDPWDEPYRDLVGPVAEHNRRTVAA